VFKAISVKSLVVMKTGSNNGLPLHHGHISTLLLATRGSDWGRKREKVILFTGRDKQHARHSKNVTSVRRQFGTSCAHPAFRNDGAIFIHLFCNSADVDKFLNRQKVN
jgi:hypothetical protein